MSGHWRVFSFTRQLLATLAVLCATAGSALGLDEGLWAVTAVEGQAAVTLPTKAPQMLKLGAAIAPGSEVATEAGSRVTLTRGKTSMTLSPESRTKIPFDSDQGQRTTIFQRFGSLLLQVDKRPEQHFEVQTPFLAAVVKGTTFTVDVGGTGASVHVSEGAVEVGALASGQVQLVRPGQTAIVGEGPNASLEIRKSTTQQGERGDGAVDKSTKAGQAPRAETKARGNGISAAAAAPVKGFKITRTIGLDNLDISSLTDGLVAPATPRVAVTGLVGPRSVKATANGAAQSRVGDGQPRLSDQAADRLTGGAAPGLNGTAIGLAQSRPQLDQGVPGLAGNPSALGGLARGLAVGAPRLNGTASGFAGGAPGLRPSQSDVGRVVRNLVNPGIGNGGQPPGQGVPGGNGNSAGDAAGGAGN